MLKITNNISISPDSITFTFSRSSGPGGQNVNKVNTRVTAYFDVATCPAFSDTQRRTILRRLATRVDKNGVVRVVSQRHRTQKANRQAAVERLEELLRNALWKKPVRKKTRVPYAARQKRLEGKRQRSALKKQRAKVGDYE
ncbi:alternative ribosome rescue aminoacyl-tRNA hydrolase ArfB [Planctomycetota bacterium]